MLPLCSKVPQAERSRRWPGPALQSQAAVGLGGGEQHRRQSLRGVTFCAPHVEGTGAARFLGPALGSARQQPGVHPVCLWPGATSKGRGAGGGR